MSAENDEAHVGAPGTAGTVSAPGTAGRPGAAGSAGSLGTAGAASTPGAAGSPVEISDPLALRALAHPARIAILEHLVLEGPATATQCAEIAGLSPTACSYHLRALAKYGFVEEDASAAVDGRHRPWRAKVVAVSFGEKADTPPAVRAAGRAVRDSLLQRVAELRDLHYEQEPTLPPEWREVGGMTQDVMHVTAAELAELRQKVFELTTAYRRLSPDERPPGARRVHATFEVFPWPQDAWGREAARGAQEDEQGENGG
jgi:DNA-binding transcriptional ArsR family regulator